MKGIYQTYTIKGKKEILKGPKKYWGV